MKYIDLGLPSGNLWAEQNEEGYYTFDEAVAKFGDCLPTKEDFEELVAHCWKRWDNERKGMELMSDNGAKIFFPALGWVCNEKSLDTDSCYCWTDTEYNDKFGYYVRFNESGCSSLTCGYMSDKNTVRLIKRGGTQ